MSTSSPPLDPTSDMAEESAELFDHSVGHLLLPDAQSFMESDVGSEVQEEAEQARGESRRPTPSKAAPVVSRATIHTSSCWAFFETSHADRTVAICKICHKGIKRGKMSTTWVQAA